MTPLTGEQEHLLEDLYYNKKNFVGRDKLYDLTKSTFYHPTKAQVAKWLSEQEIWQLHYKPKKSSSISPVVIQKPNVYYQMDLIDMGDFASYNKRYILTLIDTFTKQAFARAIRKKNDESVLKEFKIILEELKKDGKSIKVLQTDNGGEFVSKKMISFLNHNKIKHNTGIPGRPQAQGIIERFNGTLKDYIQKDISATGKNKWPLNLQTYIDNYNNSYHSVIKTTPNKASSNVANVADNIEKVAVSRKLITTHPLKVGDKVRVKKFKGKLEKSSTQNFSKSIYTIYKVIKASKPYKITTYRISNTSGVKLKNLYNANDLLKINKIRKSPIEEIKPVKSGSKKSTKVVKSQIVTRSMSKK